jgi:hypothetical protein
LLTIFRESFFNGIFALKLGNYRHNVIYSPMLIKSVLAQNEKAETVEDVTSTVMTNVFGLESRDRKLYQEIEPELKTAVLPFLQFKDGSGNNFSGLTKHLQGNLPDLITFNPSLVDQEPWERLSLLTPTSDDDVIEASLL